MVPVLATATTATTDVMCRAAHAILHRPWILSFLYCICAGATAYTADSIDAVESRIAWLTAATRCYSFGFSDCNYIRIICYFLSYDSHSTVPAFTVGCISIVNPQCSLL